MWEAQLLAKIDKIKEIAKQTGEWILCTSLLPPWHSWKYLCPRRSRANDAIGWMYRAVISSRSSNSCRERKEFFKNAFHNTRVSQAIFCRFDREAQDDSKQKEENEWSYFTVDPESVPQAEGVLFAFFSHVHVLVDTVSHLPHVTQSGLNMKLLTLKFNGCIIYIQMSWFVFFLSTDSVFDFPSCQKLLLNLHDTVKSLLLLFILRLSSSSLRSAVTFWCYSLLPCCLPLSISYFPGDGEVVLSLAAGSDDQVTLVQGLHHLLRLVETDIVEVGVGDHTLYICWREKGERKEQANIIRTVTWK